MSEKTIALSGAETEVHFSGGNAWLRNDGAAVVYAAKTAGITAGADGVISIPAGGSAPVYGANGTVFLLGSGSVQLVGSDYATNPFKTSAQAGGSGADDVARAAIEAHAGNAGIHVTAEEKAAWNAKAELTDIPTSLPANGGNADTVDGKHASDFVDVNDTKTQIEIPSDTKNPIDVPVWITTNGKRYTQYFTVSSTGRTNVPNNSETWVWYYFDGLNIIAREHVTDNVWTAVVVNGAFTGWKLINSSDADTLDGKHASEFVRKGTLHYDIFSNSLSPSHPAWNSFCAIESAEAIENAPSSTRPARYEVWTCGENIKRGYQIAVSLFERNKIFIRYLQDGNWSGWYNIADGGNAATLESHPASDFVLKSEYDALAARVAALEGN